MKQEFKSIASTVYWLDFLLHLGLLSNCYKRECHDAVIIFHSEAEKDELTTHCASDSSLPGPRPPAPKVNKQTKRETIYKIIKKVGR